MNKLDLLIHRIINKTTVSKEDVLDDIKQYWNDAVDTVGSYWNDTDEEIAEELGVTPTAIQELLEPHRSTYSYANLGGNSSISGYDHGDEWMLVLFSDGNRYLYTVKSTTPESISEMKRLASIGKGLNSYIMRLQRMNYAGRNVKGEILIKPGMESYNPEGRRRLVLLLAFRNTVMHNTISSEGLIADVKKFFGMSNKSAQKLFIDNTFGWSVIQHIERDMLRPEWLKDQTYIKGDVSGKSVLRYIGKDGKVDIPGARKQMDAFLQTRVRVKALTDSWRQKTKPAADLLIKNSRKLSPEVYAEAKAIVDNIPMEKYDVKYPTKTIVGNGVRHENPNRVDLVYTNDDRPIPALSEAEALQLASEIQRSIDEFKKNMTGAPDSWPDVMHEMVYTLQPKDYGKVPYDDWYSLIWDILSPNTGATTHDGGMVANRIYWDTIVGLVRYLDVSIKGDSIISGESYKLKNNEVHMHQTLKRYKTQIVQAGRDGLDPTARKIMAVGLNKMAKVTLEDFGDTGQAPDQQALTDAIDSELGEGDLQYSFEGIWQSIKDFFAMRPKSIHLSGRDHDLPNKLARTINDATWLSRQKYTLGEVNYRAIPDFNTSTATRYVQQYVSAVESASQVNAREMSKISERLRVVQAVYRQYAQREILDTTPIDLAIRDINPYNIRLNIQIREPVIEFGPKERQEGPALTKAEVKQFAGLVNTVFNAQRGYTASLSINTANPWKHNVEFRYRHKPGGEQVLAKLAKLDQAYNQLILMIDRELKQQITTHTAWIAAENLADSLVNYISKSITNVSSNEDYVGKFEPSNEGFIDGLRKFFSPSKDQDIYATVNKGFLYDLTAELKKYTNIQWVKDRKPVEGKKIEIDGANLIGEYDQVVSDFTQQCLQLRTKHAEVAETAFNNMEEVIQQIGKGNIKSSDDINKLITIMKATRQLKAPKPEVPKATPKKGEVKVLTPEEIVEKATKLLKLFETLGADTKYVDRWNKNFINSHAWMDWKFMGKEGDRIQTLVKDNKFGELYERAMEHVYDMRRIGSEFHHLKPWIMAEFQLIEKSVGD